MGGHGDPNRVVIRFRLFKADEQSVRRLQIVEGETHAMPDQMTELERPQLAVVECERGTRLRQIPMLPLPLLDDFSDHAQPVVQSAEGEIFFFRSGLPHKQEIRAADGPRRRYGAPNR